jgi:ubiquinone/menaquinone biosynthesis C-methylase UbiE
VADVPLLRKYDRYKASSYRSYNFKMPARYDSAYFIKLCQLPLWHRSIVEELLPEIANIKILDVGCGTGSLLADLARSGATSLAGVDLAPNILEVAHEKLAAIGAKADLHTADVEEPLPWASGSFDTATLTGTLHHFYRPGDALSAIHRVLRPGGRLLLIAPCFLTPLRQMFNLYLRFLPHDGDYHFYSPTRASELLGDQGFTVSESRRVGLWAYLLNATKPAKSQGANHKRRCS